MGDDHGGGVVLQGFFDDFAGVDGGAVDGAAEEVISGDEAAPVVEVDQGEDFIRVLSQSGGEVVRSRLNPQGEPWNFSLTWVGS